MKNIYCDISATTPISPEVQEFMSEIQSNVFGNPSSIHRFGQESKAIIEKARRQISSALNCSPGEIYFTGCGSESNNLALHGVLTPGDHLVTTTYEHPAIKKPVSFLESKGVMISRILPDGDGRINPYKVQSEINSDTKLISVMMVNNEVGTINDIAKIADICKTDKILFHTDAIQAFGKIPIDLQLLRIDMLSMSAHKLYGPKGVGALFVRRGVNISPFFLGGGQEKNLRPGTENIVGIAGFGLASELAAKNLELSAMHLTDLTHLFIQKLSECKILFSVNGSHQIPGVLNIYFPGIDAQALVVRLDMAGIAISAGAACSSGTAKSSGALLDMGIDPERASKSVRISFGKYHSEQDVFSVVKALKEILIPLQNNCQL